MLVVGGDAAAITDEVPGALFEHDVASAVELLRAELRPEDVVLVKASRAAGLERVALALLEPAAPAPARPAEVAR